MARYSYVDGLCLSSWGLSPDACAPTCTPRFRPLSSGAGPGTAIHPGALQAQVIVETMTIQTLDGINAAANDNVAVVMAPVKNLRSSLMTLSNEGRVIDENLFFFAAGMEAMTGRLRPLPH